MSEIEHVPSTSNKIFGTLPMNLTINTVILAAQEIIYRDNLIMQIGGTLVLAPVRRKLYNQMIKENLLANFFIRPTKLS